MQLGNAQAGDLELGLEGLGAGLCAGEGGGERISGRVARERIADGGLGHLRAKDDPIIPYDLRHTFGTLAVRKAPLTDLQAWIGHRDIQTTMQYVHYVPQHDAAAKLTAAFSAEGVTALAADA